MATYLPDWRLDVLHWLAGAGIARLCDEHRPRECTVGWEHSDRWPTRLVITGATLEELASWIKERAPDPLDHHGEDPRRAHGGRVLIGGAQTTRGTVERVWRVLQTQDVAAELADTRRQEHVDCPTHRWGAECVAPAALGGGSARGVPLLEHLAWLGIGCAPPRTSVDYGVRVYLPEPGQPASTYGIVGEDADREMYAPSIRDNQYCAHLGHLTSVWAAGSEWARARDKAMGHSLARWLELGAPDLGGSLADRYGDARDWLRQLAAEHAADPRHEQVVQLRARGATWAAVAEATGVKRLKAKRWCAIHTEASRTAPGLP